MDTNSFQQQTNDILDECCIVFNAKHGIPAEKA